MMCVKITLSEDDVLEAVRGVYGSLLPKVRNLSYEYSFTSHYGSNEVVITSVDNTPEVVVPDSDEASEKRA